MLSIHNGQAKSDQTNSPLSGKFTPAHQGTVNEATAQNVSGSKDGEIQDAPKVITLPAHARGDARAAGVLLASDTPCVVQVKPLADNYKGKVRVGTMAT
jgi:hypothetical protein